MVVIAAGAGSASGVPCSWAGAGGTKNIPPGLSPHTSRRGVTRPAPARVVCHIYNTMMQQQTHHNISTQTTGEN